MSRNAKIGIAAIAGIILLGVCACLGLFIYAGNRLVKSVVTNPEDIAQIRQGIAEFDVPEGYSENAMRLFGFEAIILSNYSASPESIVLMGYPADMELTQEQIDQAMEQISQQNENTSWEKVDTQTVTIQDQSVEMLVMEGEIGGYRQRRLQCIWPGKNGVITLQISGTIAGWDQAVVDAFLASIR